MLDFERKACIIIIKIIKNKIRTVKNLLSEERFRTILEILKQRKTASVTELADALNTSASTIRRDITALADMGKLKKVYGGASAIMSNFIFDESDVNTKASQNITQKDQIAQYASKLINNDDFIFIDAGTTTLRLTDFIQPSKAIFVTNGIVHAKKLAAKNLKVYIIGGEIKTPAEATTGSVAVKNIKKYNFTKCFLGTNGISIENGFTTSNIDEALIKQSAIENSCVSFVLADSSKFDKVSSVTFAKLEQARIITDKAKNHQYLEKTIIKEVSK